MPDTTMISRRALLHRSALAGGLVAASGILSGCAGLGFGDTLERIRDERMVRLGVAGERPYGYLENGVLVGGTVAVHRAVFERLGEIEVQGVLTPFSELIEGLNAGNFDAVAAGMFVTADRCNRAAFSDPVYCARSALLVPRGNPRGLRDYATVARANVPIAVLAGGVEEGYAQASGIPDERVVPVGSQEQGLALVAGGEVGAFTLTSVSLRALLDRARARGTRPAPPGLEGDNPAGQVELLEPFTPVVDGQEQLGCGAAVFRKTDEGLLAAFNRELGALRREGRVLALMAAYGFTDAEMPDPRVRTEQLCRIGGVSGGELDPLPR